MLTTDLACPSSPATTQTPGKPGVCYNTGMYLAWHRAPSWQLLVLAVAAMGVYAWGFALQTRVAALPPGFPVTALEYPVMVDDVAAGTAEEVRFLAEGFEAGTRLRIRPLTGDPVEVVLRRSGSVAYLVVTAFSGAFFWAVCAVVFLPRYREPHVPAFFWILLLYGCAVMIGGVFFQLDPTGPGVFFGLLQLICLAALPPAFLYLTLTFPGRRFSRIRLRWLMPPLWCLGAVLVAWQSIAFRNYFQSPGLETAGRLIAPGTAADVTMLLLVVVGFGILIQSVRRLGGSRSGKQGRWLLWGFAVGAAPYIFLRTLPLLVGLTPPLPAGADRILELAVPLSFVFAVVWDRFLDIDVIIRRSLLYSALALVFAATVLVPILLGAQNLDGPLAPWRAAVLLAAGLFVGLGYIPVRDLLGRAIDRALFGLGHDDVARLRQLEDHLAGATGTDVMPAVLTGALQSRLDCVDIAVETLPAGVPAATLLSRPDATNSPDVEFVSFPGEWRERGFDLGHGFRRAGDTDAVVLVGSRRSGRRYVQEDLVFLAKATDLTETAWERLFLLDKVAEETAARRRLDELNRLKSEFLAQVAHDLRTPVTSVTWSVRNLLDGLAGELEPQQREYLESVRDAATHLDMLVENLLKVSRLERAVVVADIAEFAAAPCLAAAVSTVRPLAEATGITIAVEAEDTALRADPEKFVEVLVNILDNAIKYSPPQGTITVSLDREPGGTVSVAVRDEGPGLGDLDDPFARYAQGAPSPHATRHGFGLGLYIVAQYVGMMRGTVHAGNAPGGGALFTIRLPRADSETETP